MSPEETDGHHDDRGVGKRTFEHLESIGDFPSDTGVFTSGNVEFR